MLAVWKWGPRFPALTGTFGMKLELDGAGNWGETTLSPLALTPGGRGAIGQ